MSGFQKNVAGQKWRVFAFDLTDNTAVTGDAANITAKIAKDDGTATAVGDANPTETEDGFYLFDLTQAETNADKLSLYPESSTANVQVLGSPSDVFTVPENFQETVISATGVVDGNVAEISGDATAADNLELQYDTTGLAGDTFPATQAQVGAIGNATGAGIPFEVEADNTGAAIKGVTFVGSQTGTFANTEAADGTYHVIDDTANEIDIVYQIDVGGGRSGVEVGLTGFLNSSNDELNILVYDFIGTTWDTVGTLDGQNGSTDIVLTIPLLTKHTGATGADLGLVLIRFQNTAQSNPQLNVDRLLVTAANLGQTVGYADGAIWVDTVNGVAGTEAFVNGVADNPVLTWADAKTLNSTLGVNNFRISNGSTVTLDSTVDNWTMIGANWTLALGGQSIAGLVIEGATISGTGTGTEPRFRICTIGTTTLDGGTAFFSRFTGTLTLAATDGFKSFDCASGVAGSGAPTVDMGAAVGATNVEFRRWSGGLTIDNVDTGDVVSIDGLSGGTLTLTVDGGLVEARGAGMKALDVSGGSGTVNPSGVIGLVTDNSGGAVTIPKTWLMNREVVNLEADTALSDIKLDHLVAVADSDDPVDDSIVAKLASATSDWSTFASSTDSLEAIRNNQGAGGGSVVTQTGEITASGPNYTVAWAVFVGGVIQTAGLTVLSATVYDADGTNLGLTGTATLDATSGIIKQTGTLTSPITDNTPVMVSVTATTGGTAYQEMLPAVNLT